MPNLNPDMISAYLAYLYGKVIYAPTYVVGVMVNNGRLGALAFKHSGLGSITRLRIYNSGNNQASCSGHHNFSVV